MKRGMQLTWPWLVAAALLTLFLWAFAAAPPIAAFVVGGVPVLILGVVATFGGWRWWLAGLLLIAGGFAVLVALDEHHKSQLAGPPAEVVNAVYRTIGPFDPGTAPEPPEVFCKELEHDSYRCAVTIDPSVDGVREDVEMIVNVYPGGQTFVSNLTRTPVQGRR